MSGFEMYITAFCVGVTIGFLLCRAIWWWQEEEE